MDDVKNRSKVEWFSKVAVDNRSVLKISAPDHFYVQDFLVWHGIQQKNIAHVTIQMLVWNRIIAEILIMILVVHGAFSMDQEKNGPFMDIVKLIAAPRLNYIFDDDSYCLTHV